jgi:glycosyltransferase involved in cell wall biosynthesis
LNNKILFSFIVVDSRSDAHPEWVRVCIDSLKNQLDVPEEMEIVVVNNVGRKNTIGKCFNEGVKKAKGEWCVFVGDDDWTAPDYARFLRQYILSRNVVDNNKIVNVATYMTAFDEGTGKKTALARQSTGAWKTSYLKEYPFNENLKKGIDREYIEETIKRGYLSLIVEYYFGYFYRRAKEETYQCAGDIIFTDKPADYLFVTSNRQFLHPITERLAKKVGRENIFVSPSPHFDLLKAAKVIWVEWANEKAIEVAESNVDAYKILRLHAYEAFQSDVLKKLDMNKFDKVIFIDHYIKDYVERQYGKIKGAVVIPNGVEVDKFTLNPDKKLNNKIAFAGYLSRKKGIGELILLAESLPEYEFHLAGRYQEDDIADFFNHRKPDNVFVHNWKYEDEMNEFYQDKSYIINTSLRESQGMTIMEGMLAGCKPIVRNWLGSEGVYPVKYIYKNISEFKSMLGECNPQEYRDFVINNYSINDVYPKIESLILQAELV